MHGGSLAVFSPERYPLFGSVPGVLGLIETELPGFYALLARWGRPEYLLRKLAHFSEYLLLGLLLYALLRRKFSPAVSALLAVMLAAGFALTDEWHQLSVPGRDGNLRDVLIDTAGAFTGAVLGCVLTGLRRLLDRLRGENRRHNSRKRARSPAQGGQALFCRKNSHSARRIATWGTPASRNSPDTAS